MVSLFEPVNGADPELVVADTVRDTIDLGGKVVLVLGTSKEVDGRADDR